MIAASREMVGVVAGAGDSNRVEDIRRRPYSDDAESAVEGRAFDGGSYRDVVGSRRRTSSDGLLPPTRNSSKGGCSALGRTAYWRVTGCGVDLAEEVEAAGRGKGAAGSCCRDDVAQELGSCNKARGRQQEVSPRVSSW